MKIIWTPGSVYEPAGTWDFQGYACIVPNNPYLPTYIVVAVKSIKPSSLPPGNIWHDVVVGYMTAIIRKEVPYPELDIARQLGFTIVRNMIVEDNWQHIGIIG